MEDQTSYLRELLAKPEWTDDECRWMLHYLEHTPATEMKTLLLDTFRERNIPAPDQALQDSLLERIHARMQPAPEAVVLPLRPNWWRIAVAVGGIAVLLGGGYLFLRQSQTPESVVARADEKTVLPDGNIPPGGNKARLVLGNGRTVELDLTADGRIGEGNLHKKDAELVYATDEAGAVNGNNTLITPRGGQYRVRLADGTKVWLNAASKLEYPVAFEGNERLVKLTGEAYFEVEADVQRPFFVMVDGMKVQVLGTRFNVNAYPEERQFTTTLLEGAVWVSSSKGQVTLKPGQETAYSPKTNGLKQYEGDTESAVAWKNGIITFKNDELSAVMRDLGRWYDVDVAYEPGLDQLIHVTGAMRKQENLMQALKILELTAGVHFTVEGRTVKVSR